MSAPLVLRCSSLPRAMFCPASVRDDGPRVDPVSGEGDLGEAAHALLRGLPERGAIDWDRVPEVAAEYDVDGDELRMLCAQGTKLWKQVQDRYGGAVAEVQMQAGLTRGVTLTGRPDFLATGFGGDWKTGFKDSSYREQMLGYCALALLDDTTLDRCTFTLLWVRTGEVESYTLTRADLLEWGARVVGTIADWDGRTYRPGDHCAYCPVRYRCDAATARDRQHVQALSVVGMPADLTAWTSEQLDDLKVRASAVKALAEGALDALRTRIKDGGPVEANGYRLEITETHPRKVDALKAWDILSAALTAEELSECLDVRLSRVEKAVATNAGRGKGAAAVRALGEQLEAAGAVSRTTVERLERRRA